MLVHTKHNPHTQQTDITIQFGLPDGYMPADAPMLRNAIHYAFLRLVNISDQTPRETIQAAVGGLKNCIALIVKNRYNRIDCAAALSELVKKGKIKADTSERRQTFFLDFLVEEIANNSPSYLRHFNATAPAQ